MSPDPGGLAGGAVVLRLTPDSVRERPPEQLVFTHGDVLAPANVNGDTQPSVIDISLAGIVEPDGSMREVIAKRTVWAAPAGSPDAAIEVLAGIGHDPIALADALADAAVSPAWTPDTACWILPSSWLDLATRSRDDEDDPEESSWFTPLAEGLPVPAVAAVTRMSPGSPRERRGPAGTRVIPLARLVTSPATPSLRSCPICPICPIDHPRSSSGPTLSKRGTRW